MLITITCKQKKRSVHSIPDDSKPKDFVTPVRRALYALATSYWNIQRREEFPFVFLNLSYFKVHVFKMKELSGFTKEKNIHIGLQRFWISLPPYKIKRAGATPEKLFGSFSFQLIH